MQCVDISGTWISSPEAQPHLILHQFKILMKGCVGYYLEISHGNTEVGKRGRVIIDGNDIYSGEKHNLKLGTIFQVNNRTFIEWEFGYLSVRKTGQYPCADISG